ncbi:MAG: right-handed parallel beta-helix repeat-containing protein [Bacteroidota bacterium]|nr:right-handed parallel beta-helix repeat-containing protein [Bacteroidota bacterium]
MKFRNLLLLFYFVFLSSLNINAQPLTGTKTIDNSGSGDYSTFFAAIDALNSNGVGSGGVTFLVMDGQTFNSAPLTITATGTADNQIVFKQSGTGVKPIIIFTGSSGTQAGFQLNGSDYITFDGFDIRDAGTEMENGFQLYGSASDGCQYNTIKNCVIDLDKSGTSDNGFHIQSNATSFAGTNSYNKFYNNEVKDCFKGYYFYGYSDANADIGNEINSTSGGESKIENISSTGINIYYQKQFSIKNTTFKNFSNSIPLSTLYGVYIQAGENNTITISNCNFISFLGGGDTYAIRSTAGDTLNIYSNNISDIIYTGSSFYSAFGLYIYAKTANIYNNMISGISSASSTHGIVGACGIFLHSGINVNMFYNSVLLNYVSTNSGNKSSVLYIPTNNHTLVHFSNNIFINNVNVTTGALAVAFMKGISGKYIINLSTKSNNNLYYAGTPSSKNLILYDGTTSCQTIAEYKTYVSSRPLDQKAITENVPFISSSAPYDLHINPASMTLLESAGIPINSPLVITDDIDGDLRNTTTPDIGADEGNFLSNDINPPDISYTLLSHTESPLNRAVTGVVITDYSGINVSPGTKPRLYFKRNKDSNDYTGNTSSTNGWKWIETNNASSPFEFTIDYSLLFNSGVSAGDVIQYFITAQDNNSTPNVQINSGTFNLQPASVAMNASAFPITGTINSYRISFNGTYSVGSGYKYTSLTQANGLFQAISAGSFSGNVEIQITSDLTENGAFALSQWQETGGGNYTLTISSFSNEMKTISGSSETGLIKIFGCSRVIFDGSFNGSGEYFTFRSTHIVSPVFFINDNSSYNALKNLIIESSSVNFENAAVKLGSGTNIGNIIQNCIIRETITPPSTLRHGIYVSGAGNRDTQILNNNIYDFGTSAIVLHGGCNNTLIEGNSIYHTHPSQLNYVYAIHLRNSNLTKVLRNKIYGLVLS